MVPLARRSCICSYLVTCSRAAPAARPHAERPPTPRPALPGFPTPRPRRAPHQRRVPGVTQTNPSLAALPGLQPDAPALPVTWQSRTGGLAHLAAGDAPALRGARQRRTRRPRRRRPSSSGGMVALRGVEGRTQGRLHHLATGEAPVLRHARQTRTRAPRLTLPAASPSRPA